MLLLFLSLFLHCDLLNCGELDTADFSKQPEDKHKARRYENINSYRNLLTTPFGNKAYDPSNPPPIPDLSSPFSNDYTEPILPDITPSDDTTPVSALSPSTPSNLPEIFIYPTYTTIYTGSTPNVTSPSTVAETVYITIYPPGFGPDFITVDTVPTVDPSVAAYAKKWLQEVASPTISSPKLRVPKLGQIFDYDFPNEGYLLPVRRNQKTTQRRTRSLKNNTHRNQTQPIVRQGITVPQITKRKNSRSEDEAFWHDPPETLSSHRTRYSQIVTKLRLKPGLLLGKASLSDLTNPEDVEESKKTTPGSNEYKNILRTPAMTKKDSEQTDVPLELRAATPTTNIQFVRHKLYPISTSTITQSKFKMNKIHHETYMLEFVIELTRLIATKEEEDVRDVVKHTDQIMHSFYKNRQLHWFFKPLIDVIKKIAVLLKNSEIRIIQKYAANLHHMLKERHQILSAEVNTILEYTDRLYDEEDGEQLLGVLNEFAMYPNVTLSGYWLCNSLINNFLRPYRQLTNRQQRRYLTNSVKLAMETVFASNDTTTQLSSVVRTENGLDVTIPPRTEPQCGTTRSTRVRKRKRRHRSNKRKRHRMRYRSSNCSFKID